MTGVPEGAAAVAAYVPDLMDRSKVAAAFPGTRFVGHPAELAELVDAAGDVDLVIVDLGRPGVLDVVASLGPRVVGFASHVDEETLEAARAAGVDDALARSVFFRRLPDL
ncbi:MAG: hypothetical protein S0880_24860 [Actinomycetota bacterium]|nr:hypothetical protein [Actinomycetota bacterium]